MHTNRYESKGIKDFPSRRGFASFFFRWSLDKSTRLVFCMMPDVTGRNVQRLGNNTIHWWRWIEAGFLFELMRLTDFVNSLRPQKRQRLSALASLGWLKPSEPLLSDLWEIAKDRVPMAHFLRMWNHKSHRQIEHTCASGEA